MTATDKLRQLLDERGVEHYDHEDDEPLRDLSEAGPDPATSWRLGDASVCAVPDKNGTLDIWIDHASPEQAIAATLGPEVTGETSDGYHTFDELYHHRAVLFSVIVRDHKERAWKAKAHHDGTMYDGMFIVGIKTPKGQATYHYDIEPYWDMFDCKELDRAPEWDGHTPDDAIERVATLGCGTCHIEYKAVDTRSRWYELFSTPERAAQTLAKFELDRLDWCYGTNYCKKCPYEFDRYDCYLPDGFSLLEWLRGDA